MRWIASIICASAVAVFIGCGGSDDTADQLAKQNEIAQAKKDAVLQVKTQMKIRQLQRQIRNQQQVPVGGSPPPAEAPPSSGYIDSSSSGSDYQSFHTPNVSCELDSSGATCTVISTGEDFILNAGSPASQSYGSSLPSELGISAAWDTTFTAGSVSCRVPPETEASGIECTDGSGHGFEASKEADRKSAY